jgi:quercetin dioxygenase-like cupin family protein
MSAAPEGGTVGLPLTGYVFDNNSNLRCRFPTHTNLLVVDRAGSATSEAFWVVLEPGRTPPLHVHAHPEEPIFVTEGAAGVRIWADGLPPSFPWSE